jgi:hypothetical protein
VACLVELSMMRFPFFLGRPLASPMPFRKLQLALQENVQLTVVGRGVPAIHELLRSFQTQLFVEVRSVGNQRSQPKEGGIIRDVSAIDDCENLLLETSDFGLRQFRVSFRQKRTIP